MSFATNYKFTLFGLGCVLAQNILAATLTFGEPVAVGQGNARTFVENTEAETAVGFYLQGRALENLPAHDHVYVLALPTSAPAPYNHLTLDWNVHGHIPTGVYDVPHFDFHYYFINPTERDAISCEVEDYDPCHQQPVPAAIAANYFPSPQGFAKMGWHWLDATSPEFHGQPFTATFIYGYYKGEMNFLEPMVALAFLQQHGVFEKNISRPQIYAWPGSYPTKYGIKYEALEDAYWVWVAWPH